MPFFFPCNVLRWFLTLLMHQVLKMVGNQPEPHKHEKDGSGQTSLTLGQVLKTPWEFAVAAVGLSGYGDDVPATTNLRDAILAHLKKMGFNTEEEDDVSATTAAAVAFPGDPFGGRCWRWLVWMCRESVCADLRYTAACCSCIVTTRWWWW